LIFFNRIHDANDKNYYYWYGKIEDSLRQDVYPSDFIWVDMEDKDHFGLYMWLSSDDVRPPIHYDQDHNFFIHVAGSKRFVLYPPWEWRNLYPFPRIHPRWHKSQVSYDSPDLINLPNYKNAEAYEALLSPGDILYVPPYWWHHVESKTSSISMASWSQSGVYRSLHLVYERKLEIDLVTDRIEKCAIAKVFTEMLIENIYGNGKIKDIIYSILETRWNPIKDIFESSIDTNDPKLCDFQKQFNTEKLRIRLKRDVEFTIEKLNEVQGPYPLNGKDLIAIRDLELFDFIETVVSEAIGAEKVYGFFKRCFE